MGGYAEAQTLSARKSPQLLRESRRKPRANFRNLLQSAPPLKKMTFEQSAEATATDPAHEQGSYPQTRVIIVGIG
jgi:hypothetical protein